MKDIDFDELDRAVNSLIGGKTETVEQTTVQPSTPVASVTTMPEVIAPTPIIEPAPVVTAPIIEPAPAIIEMPAPVMPQPTPIVATPLVSTPAQTTLEPTPAIQPANVKPQTITRLVAVPYPPKPRPLITTPVAPAKAIPINTFESLASKRGTGRFVDVVNPTSQNRVDSRRFSASTSETLKQMISGTTDLHEHTMPVIEPAVVAPAPIINTPAPVPVPTPILSTPVVASPVIIPATEVDDDDDIEQINSFIDNAINSTNKKQDEKPFFNDTKIEKRPLGAFNGATPQAPAPSIQFGISGNSSSASSQLPPELQNDLLSIESDTMPEVEASKVIEIPAIDAARFEAKPVEASVVETPANPVVQPQTGNVIVITPVQSPEVAPAVVTPQIPVQTSINQQYQEKPSSTPTSSAPIYDANAYHELEKKSSKSGVMMWVLRIVGLIVIGAGVGVVAFFFVLPNL